MLYLKTVYAASAKMSRNSVLAFLRVEKNEPIEVGGRKRYNEQKSGFSVLTVKRQQTDGFK